MNVGQRVWDWYLTRNLSWIAEMAAISDDERALVRVRGFSGLVPLPGSNGAILMWMFDQRDGGSPFLVVRLTEDEAQAVYDADPFTVGMLEPVRRHLEHRWAWMAVRCGRRSYVRPFRIPRYMSEDRFVEALDGAVDGCPAYRFNPTPTRSTAEIRATYRVARQLAYA